MKNIINKEINRYCFISEFNDLKKLKIKLTTGYSSPIYKQPLYQEINKLWISKYQKFPDYNLQKCTNCEKKVPGGMKTGEKFFETEQFFRELEKFKKTYLCGICRDKNRLDN